MLAGRIHHTLRFFDLQNFPLTASEIQRFLITDLKTLQSKLDSNFELSESEDAEASRIISAPVHLDTILTQLRVLKNENVVHENNGFYCLAGREEIIVSRQKGYLDGLKRERLISRYASGVKHLPFVRSVVLLGSQALGQQKASSDIDLFVITDERFIGIARFFLTLYFQVLGLRRHGKKIANRFCLNHYLAGTRRLNQDKNLYTASEYVKYRPLAGGEVFKEFLHNNNWIADFFPQAQELKHGHAVFGHDKNNQSRLQRLLEKLFQNKFGMQLEKTMISSQLRRINEAEFNIKSREELSFHPNNRKQKLFQEFYNLEIDQKEKDE